MKWLIPAFLISTLVGCAGPREPYPIAKPLRNEIVAIDTPEYERRVKKLRLTVQDAAEAIVAYRAKKEDLPPDEARIGALLGHEHAYLVGERYVFSLRSKQWRVLDHYPFGWYVNGNTGEVTEPVIPDPSAAPRDLSRRK